MKSGKSGYKMQRKQILYDAFRLKIKKLEKIWANSHLKYSKHPQSTLKYKIT